MRSKLWSGFRSVLCPVDFSEASRLALRYAEVLATRSNAALHIAYANDPLLVAAAAAALHDRQIAKRSAKELQAFIDSTLSAASRKQLRLKTHVSIGAPVNEIMKAVGRTGSDLIVVGTHGLTGADRLLMGSTTLGILQKTPIPVLAIPRGAANPLPSTSRSWPGPSIVAALELEDTFDNDVAVATHLAQWFGTSLVLLHVVSEIARPDWLEGDLSGHDRIRIARAQRRIDALAAGAPAQVKAQSLVVCGKPADEIAAVAATERAGLVITALHDRRRWFGASRGSISYHVLTQAITPVLAYPPRWRPKV